MLLTIFKYLWILPLAVVYIIWTIIAFKSLIQFIKDRKKFGRVSCLSKDYGGLFTWVVIHLIFVFVTSFAFFCSDNKEGSRGTL